MTSKKAVHAQTGWIAKLIFIFGLPFCFWMIYVMWLNKEFIGALFFGALAALIGYCVILAFTSKIIANDESIMAHTIRGKYRMQWKDVERIEKRRSDYLLIGNERRFPFSAAIMGKEKKELLALVNEVADAKNIMVEEVVNFTVGNYVQKNTKIGDE